MKTKSPLSYFGSDAAVAERIGRYFDTCSHVTIPFVGGASILPYLKATRIVANDLNDLAINFYKVAKGEWGSHIRLLEQCEHTLSHPAEVQEAANVCENKSRWDSTTVAWAYWALCWLGRGGQGGTEKITEQTKPSFRMSPSGGSNASRIRSAAGDLEAWAEHFRRCEWTCLDFKELLMKVKRDNSKCGLYVDPPWIGDGDAYQHKFTEVQHVSLAQMLLGIGFMNGPRACRVLLRYGDNAYVRGLYHGDFWIITEVKSRNHGNNAVDELWITNYPMKR